jgi:Holliday junction resolvase RusA-like endonuclease
MTDDKVSFYVVGTPIPQGSKTIARRGTKTWLRDANANRLRPWRHTVAAAADQGVTFDAPVKVTLSFVLPRPKRPRWLVPAVKPDIDKLTRSTLDGLTDGGLLYDDSRVVELHVTKRYATPGDQPGVGIDVEAW